MVQFNFSERTIKAKVVYYGPAQSGKTTNLEQIHRLTDPAGQNRLISLNTAQDRTLFFDLLPFSLGAVAGYDFKVQLYTVPGQVQYNATRRVVLAGADAVVFVADSRKASFKENLAAFENMKVNLLANRLVPEKIPLVFQYNKQDLPDLQAEADMNRSLNHWGRTVYRAVAARGAGVLETVVAVLKEMLQAIAVKYNLKEKGLDPASVPGLVEEAFAALLQQNAANAPPSAPPPPARIVVAQPVNPDSAASLQATPDMGLVSEELLHRAIRSNVELAEVLTGVVREVNQGLATILSQAELLTFYREEEREKRTTALGAVQREAERLRQIMRGLGNASASASAAPPAPAVRTSSASPPPSPAAPPLRSGAAAAGTLAAAPRARVVSSAPAPAAPGRPAGPSVAVPGSQNDIATPAGSSAPTLESTLRDALALARSALDGRGMRLEVRVAPGSTHPRCPAPGVSRAVAALLQGVSAISPTGSAAVLRCERKPVLLRGRDGAEVRREFLMLALAHGAGLPQVQQQQAMQGNGPGPLGEAGRLVRELGGFIRFAPLPGGGLESRVFLPAA
jgi:signal recognition particle receptor subunit beta